MALNEQSRSGALKARRPKKRSPKESSPLTISIDEVARIWGICRQSAYTAARNGQVPGAFRVGRRYLVARKAFLSAMGE